jgi:molybdopterin molybdotransferase
MISLQEATLLVLNKAHSFGKEKVYLDDAIARVLSKPIVADRDYPPFNRATMDGIAININDWNNGIHSFQLAEIIYAGGVATKGIDSGECYKIMTGASVPASANVVVRIEDVNEQENTFTITASEVNAFQNIAVKGKDIKQQTPVIDTNVICSASVITLLASLGYHQVAVEKLPVINIITTGDEIVNITDPVNEVQVRNSNAHLLKALLHKWKIVPAACEHVKDDAALLSATVKKYQSDDILILSGAVSAGDADFVPKVLMNAGAKKIFHKVAIRPGKPIWFGQFENGATVFALPGNPFSTLATFKLFIEGFLYACFDLKQPAGLTLPIDDTRIKKTNLDEFFPVKVTTSPAAALPLTFNTSGDITAALFADALALHPVDKMELRKGDVVDCLLL